MEAENSSDASFVQQLWEHAKQELAVVKRQAIVYSMYGRKHKSVMVGALFPALINYLCQLTVLSSAQLLHHLMHPCSAAQQVCLCPTGLAAPGGAIRMPWPAFPLVKRLEGSEIKLLCLHHHPRRCDYQG
jgi:hypothetical protein